MDSTTISIIIIVLLATLIIIPVTICSVMSKMEQKQTSKSPKHTCELCRMQKATMQKFGLDLCEECSNGYSALFQGNKEAIEKYSDSERFPNASPKAVREIISLACSKKFTPESIVNTSDTSDEQSGIINYESPKTVCSCELCRSNEATDRKFGVELCTECCDGYIAVLRGDNDALSKYADIEKFPNASIKAINEIIYLARDKMRPQTTNTAIANTGDTELHRIQEELMLMRKENEQVQEDIHQISKDVRFFKIILIIWLWLFGGTLFLSLSRLL